MIDQLLISDHKSESTERTASLTKKQPISEEHKTYFEAWNKSVAPSLSSFLSGNFDKIYGFVYANMWINLSGRGSLTVEERVG